MKLTCILRAVAVAAVLTLGCACAALAPAALAAPATHAPPASVPARGATGPADGPPAAARGATGPSDRPGAAARGATGSADDGRDRYAAERTPLDIASATTTSSPKASSSGSMTSTIVRTIVGLFIVIAVVYGLAWILRQFKRGREGRASGSGLASLANLPLGRDRSLALVRAGSDLLLIGVGEHGVTPIRRYSEEQARAAGLLGPSDDFGDELAVTPGAGRSSRADAAGGEWRPVGDGGGVARMIEALRRWTVRS